MINRYRVRIGPLRTLADLEGITSAWCTARHARAWRDSLRGCAYGDARGNTNEFRSTDPTASDPRGPELPSALVTTDDTQMTLALTRAPHNAPATRCAVVTWRAEINHIKRSYGWNRTELRHQRSPNLVRTRRLRPQPRQDRQPRRMKRPPRTADRT